MVLEPLSAFSVACNVIQIIEVGCKVLSTASDYRKATDGVLEEQKELLGFARTLDNLSTGLQDSLSVGPTSGQVSEEETRLIAANNECLRVSKDFIGLLDRLKVKNRHATVESFRMSIKTRWYKDRIDTLQHTLAEVRNNLNIAFLLYMHSKQKTTSDQISSQITTSTAQVEQNVLAVVNSSSATTQEEVRKLAEQLKETFLDSENKTAAGFISMHQDILNGISTQISAVLRSQNQSQSAKGKDVSSEVQQKILNSLHFDQIHDRQDQVHRAYASTYQWMFRSLKEKWQRWHCFSTWLDSPNPNLQLYWIHGKPGSGKSTIMKFLDDNISFDRHASNWFRGDVVLKARYFFWSSGSILQRSLPGLYRSLLSQLLEQVPDMVAKVVPLRKWNIAGMSGVSRSLEWSNSELRTTLEDLIHDLQPRAKAFFLIDGLDEFEGSDEEREDLIRFLCDLSLHEKVKICVSSRPSNVFQDHLGQNPQLRMEDLTLNDIQVVVESHLMQHSRFRLLSQMCPEDAGWLVESIISKAGGVFLWVRLVINDLLRGLRDGDSLRQLQRKLNVIPLDLDKYFLKIVDSIQPQHRREAAVMLQLALHQEDRFVTLRRLCLSDVLFLEEEREDFVIQPGYDLRSLNLKDRQSLVFHVDSAFRILNSRCMGLLECVHKDRAYGLPSHKVDSSGKYETSAGFAFISMASWSQGESSVFKPREITDDVLRDLLEVRVEFFHRTLRDFLLTPAMQQQLSYHTDGLINARTFLCSARIVYFAALVDAGVEDDFTSGLASYLLCALSVNRDTETSRQMATRLEDAMTHLANKFNSPKTAPYVKASLKGWHKERSNFLTLAIDFRLSSYVLAHMSPIAIQEKSGRPILDYILRPRFMDSYDFRIDNQPPDVRFDNQPPDIRFLEVALRGGADPNQIYRTCEGSASSVWAFFLCSCRHFLKETDSLKCDRTRNYAYQLALCVLIKADAHPVLSEASLSAEKFSRVDWDLTAWRDGLTPPVRFRRRWPGLKPICHIDVDSAEEKFYAVSDILKGFRNCFESDIGDLIQEVKAKEPVFLKTLLNGTKARVEPDLSG